MKLLLVVENKNSKTRYHIFKNRRKGFNFINKSIKKDKYVRRKIKNGYIYIKEYSGTTPNFVVLKTSFSKMR